MRLKVISSSSQGNSYILTDNQNNRLLLECGIHPMEIKKELDFNLKNVWCIVTHGHQDHCKAMPHLLASGIKIYASKGTLEETNTIEHHNSRIMEPLKKYQIGPFTVLGYPVQHDTREPYGFLINHEESGPICFLTDTYYTKYKFRNVVTYITECNYDEEIIDNDGYGAENTMLRNRVLTSHLSIQNLIKMLKANDLSKTNNIILTHLSDRNSNEREFIEKIKKATGKITHVANPGLELEINLNLF